MKTLFPYLVLLLCAVVLGAPRANAQKVQGRWLFDTPSKLTAAVPGYGKDLILVGKDSAIAGPTAGNGAVRIPKGSWYKLVHGFKANGGGGDSVSRVNEYSIMIDFRLPDLTRWYAFFQTDMKNASDGDCFVKPTSGIIGTTATKYSTDAVAANQWYRFVISIKNGVLHNTYIDGKLIVTGTPLAVDGRFALDSMLLMFGDDDGDDGDIDVAELAMWDRALTDKDVAAMKTVGTTYTQGRWTFDNAAKLTAAVKGFGNDLVLVGKDSAVAGPGAGNGAVRIPKGSHYKVYHGFKPNGGGGDSVSYVNEYSIMVDFRLPDLTRWYTFFQTNSLNANDGDCFVKPTTGVIGTTATQYTATGVVANQWYRLILSIKNGVHHNTYLDGKLALAGTALGVDGRFGLDSLLIAFGDDDGDDGDIDIAELAMWDRPLTEAEAAALGKVPTTTTSVRHGSDAVAERYELLQNYPNPFNPSTQIAFSIPTGGWVSVKVYDLLGRQVATVVDSHMDAGMHATVFNAGALSSGMYFYRIEAGSFTAMRKLLFVK